MKSKKYLNIKVRRKERTIQIDGIESKRIDLKPSIEKLPLM